MIRGIGDCAVAGHKLGFCYCKCWSTRYVRNYAKDIGKYWGLNCIIPIKFAIGIRWLKHNGDIKELGF